MEGSALVCVFCGFVLQLTPIIRFQYTFATQQPTNIFYAKPQRICVYGVRVSCFLGKPIEKMLQGEVAHTSQDLLKKGLQKKANFAPFQ